MKAFVLERHGYLVPHGARRRRIVRVERVAQHGLVGRALPAAPHDEHGDIVARRVREHGVVDRARDARRLEDRRLVEDRAQALFTRFDIVCRFDEPVGVQHQQRIRRERDVLRGAQRASGRAERKPGRAQFRQLAAGLAHERSGMPRRCVRKVPRHGVEHADERGDEAVGVCGLQRRGRPRRASSRGRGGLEPRRAGSAARSPSSRPRRGPNRSRHRRRSRCGRPRAAARRTSRRRSARPPRRHGRTRRTPSRVSRAACAAAPPPADDERCASRARTTCHAGQPQREPARAQQRLHARGQLELLHRAQQHVVGHLPRRARHQADVTPLAQQQYREQHRLARRARIEHALPVVVQRQPVCDAQIDRCIVEVETDVVPPGKDLSEQLLVRRAGQQDQDALASAPRVSV